MDKKGKIWNKNYILLLQGQLVSTIGDSLYSIALAFFVLKLTGSTALVGMIMGIVTIPRIILGPFAGTIVDRYNRKMLILSIVTIKDEIKYHVYRLSVFAFIGFVTLGAAVNKFWSVVVCFILAFIFSQVRRSSARAF